jgi:uncharacterized protein
MHSVDLRVSASSHRLALSYAKAGKRLAPYGEDDAHVVPGMKVVVTGATGFIGNAVVAALTARGDVVTALVRTPAGADFPPTVRVLRFDAGAPPDPSPFEGADAVIHLAGESVAGRWTSEKKRAILESREHGTRAVVASLAACASRPRALLAASAVGYYGERGDAPLIESSLPGRDFLADVCAAWETESFAAERLGVRVAVLRQGLVYGPGGGALEAMLAPFRAFAGGPFGNGTQWVPWIHLDDDVALFLFALDNHVKGPINAVSPDVATSARFARALGHALGRPSLAFAPSPALYLVLGEFASSLLVSQLVLPDAALAAGFAFKHEMLEQALLDILAPGSGRIPALQTLESSSRFDAPIETVFAFFADARNLARITPRELGFRMLTPQPVAMRRGAVIEYALRIRGVPVRWKSLISDWRPGARFVDYQLRGLYDVWRHEHRFARDGEGTVVEDRVTYGLPLAPLSDVALPMVRADLARVFRLRGEVAPALIEMGVGF